MKTENNAVTRNIKYDVICAPGKVKTPTNYKFYFERQHVRIPRQCFYEHSHNFFEFFLVDSGDLVHTINGQREILVPGDLRFILPEDIHQLTMKDSKGYAVYNCNIEAELFQNCFRLLTAGTISARDLINRIHLNDTVFKEIRVLIEQTILLQSTANIFQTRLHGRALIIRVLQILLEIQDSADSKPEWLKELCTKMQKPENFMLGVRRLFELTDYTQEHVSRCIRKYLGITPQQLIQEYRLQNVARELIYTTLPIGQIAVQNGFGNYAYFHKSFLTRYECTPLQFRKKYNSGEFSTVKM